MDWFAHTELGLAGYSVQSQTEPMVRKYWQENVMKLVPLWEKMGQNSKRELDQAIRKEEVAKEKEAKKKPTRRCFSNGMCMTCLPDGSCHMVGKRSLDYEDEGEDEKLNAYFSSLI